MPVNSTHPDYCKYSSRWDLVRSIVENDAMHWIRNIDEKDTKQALQYRQEAILTNFTALTKSGLVGLVYRRDPDVDLPDALSYLLDNANGEDFGLLQLGQQIVGEVLQSGRYGLLIDYPESVVPLSLKEQQVSGNAAMFKTYCAASVINWHNQVIGNKNVLSLVVLKENVDQLGADGFLWVKRVQYRVLRLNADLEYVQEIYNQELEFVSGYKPLDAKGLPWNEIPFIFVGAQNNNTDVDNIPLYDLAVLNRGHYRNSADYEESIYICGQPSLFISTEMSKETFDDFNPGGVRLGVRSGHNLGPNGKADLLQANPNQLVATAMKEKMVEALLIGARLIAPPGGRETAEAARMRYASQNSALYIVVNNISKAVQICLQWALKFMSKDSYKCEFKLNDQFYDETADPNMLNAMQMLLDRGVISKNDVRYYGRKTGFILEDKTDDEIEEEAGQIEPPTGF